MAAKTPNDDLILVQTDATFDLALVILTQLRLFDLLQVEHVQMSEIYNIESNNDEEEDRFVYGGEDAEIDKKRTQAFARTASSVLRMNMLNSAKVMRKYWPPLGKDANRRNKKKVDYTQLFPKDPKQAFVLTKDRERAEGYYSRYDHMHPHFKLEHELHNIQPNEWWYMPQTMMLIFRRDFSECIEFSTSLKVRYRPDIEVGTYQSYANVRCIVRRITNTEHESLDALKLMKAGSSSQITVIATLKKYEDDWNLPDQDEIIDPDDELKGKVAKLPSMKPKTPQSTTTKSRRSIDSSILKPPPFPAIAGPSLVSELAAKLSRIDLAKKT